MLLWMLFATALPPAQDTALTAAALRSAAAVVRTIDPQDQNFSDLQRLKTDLAGAQIVVLGEAHSDGATLQAKARLVKFLHQEMGFDVLIIEHDMLGVREDVRDLLSGTRAFDLRGPLGTNRTLEHGAVLQYVVEQSQGARPLDLIGMDPSYFVRLPTARFGSDVIAFFDKAGATMLPEGLRSQLQKPLGHPYLTSYRETYSPRIPPDSVAAANDEVLLRSLLALIAQHRRELNAAHGGNEVRLLEIGLGNRLLHLRLFADRQQTHRSNDVFAARDSLMALGIGFLMDEFYRGRKVIVSVGTHHVMRNGDDLGVAGFENLAERLVRMKPGAVRTVGFVAHQGNRGVTPGYPMPVEATLPGSLEWAASETGAEYLWIKLDSLPGKYRSKLGGFITQHQTAWKNHFDFAFFIRQQRTLTPVR